MNKKTTTKKSAVKARSTAKTRVSTAKTKPATKATSKVASKTTQRKGIKHHAKRVYHMTPKFIHGAIAGAFVGIVIVSSLGYASDTSAVPATDDCIKTAAKLVFKPNGEPVDKNINVNNSNANVYVKLADGCGDSRKVVMKAWWAPNNLGGQNGDKQYKYDVTNSPLTIKKGQDWQKIHVQMFDNACYYQVDLVDETKPQALIVRAATGGNKSCMPAFKCESLALMPLGGRTVEISKFKYSTNDYAKFTGATVNWGDGPVQEVGDPTKLQHTYPNDATYTVKVTAHFSYDNKEGNSLRSACSAPITFTSVPNSIFVCEISTKRIINIDSTLYGSPQYPLDKYTKDLSQCEVTSTPETPDTPQTLANTGPGAVLIVLGLATLGGYVFHMRHRRAQHRKHTKRHA